MRGVVLTLSAGAVVAAACVWACLPDLVIVAPPGPFCGDGIISPDAGEQCDPGLPDGSAVCSNTCQVLCTAASISGVAPFTDPSSFHCYFSLKTSQDIDAAATACEAAGAHIVRFVSQSEVGFVTDAGGAAVNPFWVGLKYLEKTDLWLPYEPTNEPGWAQGCGGCFAKLAPDASSIDPDDAGLGCVISGDDPTSAWRPSFCLGKLGSFGAVCEREPVGRRITPCAQGACFTIAATQSSKSYVLIETDLGSNDAVQACAALGGGLAVYDSPEEREQVGYEIGIEGVVDSGQHDFWIGLSAPDGAAWGWESRDGGGLEPQPWKRNEPAGTGPQRAVVAVTLGVLDSELALTGDATDGGDQHQALCQIPAP